MQRAGKAGWRGRRDVRERRLLENELLEGLGRVSAAEHFALGLAVGGARHVGIERHRLPHVRIEQTFARALFAKEDGGESVVVNDFREGEKFLADNTGRVSLFATQHHQLARLQTQDHFAELERGGPFADEIRDRKCGEFERFALYVGGGVSDKKFRRRSDDDCCCLDCSSVRMVVFPLIPNPTMEDSSASITR